MAEFTVSTTEAYLTNTGSSEQNYITKTVDFYDLSANSPTSWSWDFGAGAVPATSTDQNPSCVYYTSTGAKTVTLTATNVNGSDMMTKTSYFTVAASPNARRDSYNISSQASANSTGPAKFPVNVYGSSFIDPDNGWVVGYKGLIRKTANGTLMSWAAWTCQYAGTDADLLGAYAIDINTCYAVGEVGTILKTTDGGTTWSPLTSGTAEHLWSVWFPADAITGYVSGGNGTILKTIDGGSTWNPLTSGTTSTLYGICFSDATTGYACGAGGTIIKTTDASTWSPLTSGTTNDLRSIDFYAGSASGYACGAGGTLIRTGNSGSTWVSVASGTTNTLYTVQSLIATIGAETFVAESYVVAGELYWKRSRNRSVPCCGSGSGGSGAIVYTYYTSWNPPASPYVSWISTGTGGFGPVLDLPIELVSFFGQCKNNQVKLVWFTASEVNNDYFTIERAIPSNSSQGGELNWLPIETVKGAGNSSTIRSYEFVDQSPSLRDGWGGFLYYRLKQTDYDGIFEYSPVTSVRPCDENENAFAVFPNPSSGIFTVLSPIGNFRIEVYNALGERVYKSAITEKEYLSVDLSVHADGVYFIIIQSKNQSFTKKAIILHQ